MRKVLFLLITFLSLTFSPSPLYAQPLLNVHFISVGFGDAILIQSVDGKNILVDAGGKENAQTLLDYLYELGVLKIDAAIITHPHKNHFENFMYVLNDIPIRESYINGDKNVDEGYDNLLARMRQEEIPVRILQAGEHLTDPASQVSIDVLNPSDLKGNVNGNSIALLLKYKKVSVFLTSDIGIQQQRRILEEYPEVRQAQYVQVPHHGGHLDASFINGFKETTFIVSTGKNIYGFPIEKDLAQLKGDVIRTDKDGIIVISTDGYTATHEIISNDVFKK